MQLGQVCGGNVVSNLFIIGAPRSGTTFLFSVLGQHPKIFAPSVKEPHFHLADCWPLNGPERATFTQPLAEYLGGERAEVWGGLMTSPDDYAALYRDAGDAVWRMDATPNYFAEGAWMAQRIRDRAGHDARIIIMLREPVERTRSHHRLFQSLGWEDLDFDAAIKAGPTRCKDGWAPTWDYLKYSQYAEPLAEWQAVFGDQLRVVAFEDLTWQPQRVIEDIQTWLGVSPFFDASTAQQNAAPAPVRETQANAEDSVASTGRLDVEKERAVFSAAKKLDYAPPRVTVGMPVLNGAKTIRTAIDSILAQTYPNLELVVCNNNSDDETAAIVTEIAATDHRLILKNFDSRGDIRASYARALATADGDYFMFAPCDDTWDAGFIAAAVCRLQLDPDLSVCCGRIELLMDDGSINQSTGVQEISGPPWRRWRDALMLTIDASRLYGLLRVSALDNLIPDSAPEGWDHYSAAKLALRGGVVGVDALAMRRGQTPDAHYLGHIHRQERSFWRQVFYLRHVRRLFLNDPDFATQSLGARLTLWGYVFKYSRLPLLAQRRIYKRFYKFGEFLGRIGRRLPF